MKLKLWLLLLPLLGMSVAVSAQSSLPRKVSDVTLLDLNGDPTQLPYWGEKNLMIFYIDPTTTNRTRISQRIWRKITGWKAKTCSVSG